MRLGSLLLVAFLALASSARASGLESLLDAVVEAYGGETALQRLSAFRVEAEVASRMQGAVGQVRRDYQSPDRLRVRIVYPGRTEVRVLDGDRGWRGDEGRLERVEGLPKLAMVYQMLRSALPESLLRHRRLLEDRGTVAREGSECRRVGLPWSRELDLSFWIESATHRIVRVEGLLGDGGAQSRFATDYGDFRKVEGALIPFSEENFASGQHTGTTRLVRVVYAPKDLGPFDLTGNRR